MDTSNKNKVILDNILTNVKYIHIEIDNILFKAKTTRTDVEPRITSEIIRFSFDKNLFVLLNNSLQTEVCSADSNSSRQPRH